MKINSAADEYGREIQEKREKIEKGFSKEQAEFVNDAYYAASWQKKINSSLGQELLSGLGSGKYQKPSEFFLGKTQWLFEGYILSRFKEHFLYAVDNCNKYQYSSSYYRRSFRTSDYRIHIFKILDMVNKFQLLSIDKSLCDIMSYKVTEQERAYMESKFIYQPTVVFNAQMISYELDRENKELEELLTDILMGDGELYLNREIIRGIVQSENKNMHELLGKLLLAARQQEGLRQAICEAADAGTVSAFLRILNVIKDNNLIRFSSVKRAVGTWIGLISTESNDLDRISEKSIELIAACVEDRKVCEEYLATEDSMKIYLALWAYGFYEAKDAMERIYKIADSGTEHQLLTAGYFAANLDNIEFAHHLSKKVIEMTPIGKGNILAVYLPHFMSDWKQCNHIKKYYENQAEAEKYYDILINIYETIPKKALEFSPCIFPWYQATLTKSDVIVRLGITAMYLEDGNKKDFTSSLIKDVHRDDRERMLSVMLESPDTPAQKMILTEELCDKETYTRKKAYNLIQEVELEPEHYLKMEEMLKYKASDMRSNLIALLYQQTDEMLYGTIKRLTEDKKEEKRTAGLDLLMQLAKDEERKDLYEKCKVLTENFESASTKEKILLENIVSDRIAGNGEAQQILFTEEDRYVPSFSEDEYTKKSIDLYMKYFPDAELKKAIYQEKVSVLDKFKTSPCQTANQALEDCKLLSKCVTEHENDEFIGFGGAVRTVGGDIHSFYEKIGDYDFDIPLIPIWKEWYEQEIKDLGRLVRMWVLLSGYSGTDTYTENTKSYIIQMYGKGFEEYPQVPYPQHMYQIVNRLLEIYMDKKDKEDMALAVGIWYIKCVPKDQVVFASGRPADRCYQEGDERAYLIYHAQILLWLFELNCHNDERFQTFFVVAELVAQKTFDVCKAREPYIAERSMGRYYRGFFRPSQNQYIIAAFRGMITERAMYCYLFNENNIGSSLDMLSTLVAFVRDSGREVSGRGISRWSIRRSKDVAEALVGKKGDFTQEDKKLLEFADRVYQTVIDKVLDAELKRGDSETEYSEVVRQIHRIYGMENFIAILSALGKDTLERSGYSYSTSKKGCLSHLLSACIPKQNEDAEKLEKMLKGTDITDKRLIEAAMYSVEWIDIVGEYLGFDGFSSACYYFMAHMNEYFDDKRKAVIARYTPLTEEELNAGAFDIKWFRQAYEMLGEKRFQMIYNAAKYISDGSKHARARKYADAVLGKMDITDTEDKISDKRNKDLLMAYPLIPLTGEDDICRRYLFLQKFLKESKQFGSQRIASEKKAVEMAMENLSINAGYTDSMRLTLRMETKLTEDSRGLFEDRQIEDIIIRLEVDETGKAGIVCSKDGKRLKSVPARIKKNEYVVLLTATKKKLTEQYRRTRILFEQAMEDRTTFTVDEIMQLRKNPVVSPILCNLLFVHKDKIGFLNDSRLTDFSGKTTGLQEKDEVFVAHPIHLYQDGHWTEYQKNLFERRAVQPFKQVFRELYVKTEEEMEMNHSLRYAGNQIQPAKTIACLKSRRWVADIEDGLQKVYYQENIVARIYAMADWFSPADVEAPTLEWVEFSNRHTGESISIKDVPDIIFSEVMRDVDLAVSVAHAGGVDPETSHSTIEMRAALLSFTLPLFKIKNVVVNQNHALVEGKYGNYTIHLGSGVVHKQGGTMIPVLPVHSQHRGKLFLPFVDEDPKTAEIISKVLLFAEDTKIKDPDILAKIR